MRRSTWTILGAAVLCLGIGLPVAAGRSTPEHDSNQFVPVSPSRMLDTRDGTGGTTGPIAADTSFDLQITGTPIGDPIVPVGAIAVVLNLTYVDGAGPGFITVWPHGEQRPLASSLNKVGAGPLGNMLTVKLGADGALSIFNQRSPAHFVADIAGYYLPSVAGAARQCQPGTFMSGLDADGNVMCAAPAAAPTAVALSQTCPAHSYVIAIDAAGAVRCAALEAHFTSTVTSIGFGTLGLGTETGFSDITVTNIGDGESGIISVTSDSSDFVASTGTCAGTSLAPGDTCTARVKFAPTVVGARSATLTIAGAASGTKLVPLIGTGATPMLVLVTPATLTPSYSGGAWYTMTVDVTNIGTIPATVGPNWSVGTIGWNDISCGSPLAPGATCSFLLHLFESTPGTYEYDVAVVPGIGPTRTFHLTFTRT